MILNLLSLGAGRGISLIQTLNNAGGTVKAVARPWLGVFWLSRMPYRFLQVYFLLELAKLGPQAKHYGDYLFSLSLALMLALVVSTYGRAVFVRACFLSQSQDRTPGAEAWRVRPADLLTYLYCDLLLEVIALALWWTFIFFPFCFALSGIAGAISYNVERPSLIKPLVDIAVLGVRLKNWLGMLCFFGFATLITWINLYFAFQAGEWLAGGIFGIDLSRWQYLLRPMEYVPILPAEWRPALLMLAGAALAVEPFWLAANVVFVQMSRAQKSGEDLRYWFDSIRGKALS